MHPPPYKTKMVEPIVLISRAERIKKIKRAGYNLFFLNSEDVYIDLLTDSGTGAMSEHQWAQMMQGDESYAGSTSFRNLQKSVQAILGFRHIIPVHQGRGAEQVFNKIFVRPGMIVPGNAHFDTTRAHIENCGGVAIDCTIENAYTQNSNHPFKGNIDLIKLEKVLKKYSAEDESDTNGKKKVAYILITITCNQAGGQPVSMANIKAVSRLSKKYKVSLFFDIARFAENAYFIKTREPKYKNKSVRNIIREMMDCANGALMSAKKDAIVNIGGFIALRTEGNYNALAPGAILMEGFLHYGGMSGRDMEALAVGLWESTEEEYLCHRVSQVKYLREILSKAGIPVLKPAGGHAVYIDAKHMLPDIPWYKFPGQILAIAAYIEGGVRSVEIGSLMQGRNPQTKENLRAKMELLRLAIPRRVYSQEHLDYIASVFSKIWQTRNHLRGVRFDYESPILRHFSSRFRLL
jgi:tryptophanase